MQHHGRLAARRDRGNRRGTDQAQPRCAWQRNGQRAAFRAAGIGNVERHLRRGPDHHAGMDEPGIGDQIRRQGQHIDIKRQAELCPLARRQHQAGAAGNRRRRGKAVVNDSRAVAGEVGDR